MSKRGGGKSPWLQTLAWVLVCVTCVGLLALGTWAVVDHFMPKEDKQASEAVGLPSLSNQVIEYTIASNAVEKLV